MCQKNIVPLEIIKLKVSFDFNQVESKLFVLDYSDYQHHIQDTKNIRLDTLFIYLVIFEGHSYE